MSKKKNKSRSIPRNAYVKVMLKRGGGGKHSDKRQRRKDRKSWRKQESRDWG